MLTAWKFRLSAIIICQTIKNWLGKVCRKIPYYLKKIDIGHPFQIKLFFYFIIFCDIFWHGLDEPILWPIHENYLINSLKNILPEAQLFIKSNTHFQLQLTHNIFHKIQIFHLCRCGKNHKVLVNRSN